MPAIISDHHVVTPPTRDEALRFLAAHRDEGWVPLAGGTDLMVGLYRDRNPPGRRWLNLWELRPELAAIGREGELIRVGGLATMTELRRSSLLRAACPLIAQAASVVGAIQIQNRATVAGNIVTASPAGDTLPVWLALDAEIELHSVGGVRRLPYARFMTGYRRTVREPDELLTAVLFQPPGSGTVRLLFRKVGTRAAQAISKVAFAGIATLDEYGRYRDIRLAFGSMGPTPLRAGVAERFVAGSHPDADLGRRAAELLSQDLRPIDDLRSTADYRMRVARNLVREFVGGGLGEVGLVR